MKQALVSNTDTDKRLIFLVNTIKEIIWEADIDGNIVYANNAWYEYMNRRPGTDISEAWLEFIHPDDLAKTVATWKHSLETGSEYQAEYRLREASTGRYHWFLGRANPYRNEEGAIERWYGTCVNIEERKENIALHEMNQAKDEFISIASHQLRTPATAVKQYIGMSLDGYAGDLTESQQLLLEKAYENNERQLRIVTDLLRVANIEMDNRNFVKHDVDIAKLAHKIVNGHTNSFKDRQQSISFNSSNDSVMAYVDQDAIMTVFDNILENASKYTPEHGDIVVTIKDDDSCAYIEVADTGVGISQNDQTRLFRKFSRIENELSTKVGGTGLGLYWVKKVMGVHGGDITYRPNIPRGSVFTLVLPKSTTNSDKERTPR